MRHTPFIAGLAVALAAVSVPQARADSVTFAFWGAGILNPNYVDVTQLPQAPLASISTVGGTLTQSFVNGLGVDAKKDHNGLIDPSQSIDFHFNPTVSISSISFTSFFALDFFGQTVGDQASLSFSSDNGGTWTTVEPTILGLGLEYPITVAADANITDFMITAEGSGSQFGIGNLTVDYTPVGGGSPPPVAPLPSAAASGLGVLGLLGIAAFARRRRLASV